MKTRIITGAVLAVVLGLLVYFGTGNLEFLFSSTCVVLATFAAFEFVRMSRNPEKLRWFDFVAVILTLAFSTISVIYFDRPITYYIIVFVFLFALILFYSLLFVTIKDFTSRDFGNQILTIFYTSLGFIAFAYLRIESMNLIIYLFLVTMLTDVFAYFVGIKFGKHRLAVTISPKKSIEGAVGGLVIGSVLATIFAYYLNVFNFSFWIILIVSIILSVISQVGDLIASKFKRETGIKDYSNLFPGHGGVLDRFDSSMFAAIFLMLALFLGILS